MTSGIGYAFFACRSHDVRDISETVGTAWGLTGQLPTATIDLRDARVSDISELLEPGAHEYAALAAEANLPYVLRMTSPNATGRAVADEIGGVLNQLYNTHLYEEGEEFRGEIVYRDAAGVFQQY